jgi:hypothetical protein
MPKRKLIYFLKVWKCLGLVRYLSNASIIFSEAGYFRMFGRQPRRGFVLKGELKKLLARQERRLGLYEGDTIIASREALTQA